MFRNLITRFISSSSSASSTKKFELPLQEIPLSNGRKDSNESRSAQFSAAQPRSGRRVVISTAIAISLRVVLSRLILDNAQCSISSVEVRALPYRTHCIHTKSYQGYLPLLLAIYDYWYVQRRRQKSENSTHTNGQSSRHLWPIFFLTAAYSVKAFAMGAPRSTYICPLSSSAYTGVPLMQILSILLECYVLVNTSGITSTTKVEPFPKSEDPSVAMGCVFLVDL